LKKLNKKLISLTLLAILAIGTIASVYGYQEYFYEWEDEGGGEEHGGCDHGDDDAIVSTDGEVSITLITTGTIAPYEEFVIMLEVTGFVEPLEDPYDGRFIHGISGYKGDNDEFSIPTTDHSENRRERVDDNGDYLNATLTGHSAMGNYYTLVAPGSAGTYTLVATAIAALNQSSGDEYPFVYCEGSIEITVVGSAGGSDDSIPGFITVVMLSAVGVAVLAIVLTVRRKKGILK